MKSVDISSLTKIQNNKQTMSKISTKNQTLQENMEHYVHNQLKKA